MISQINRYVKVKGHSNWFLCLSPDDYLPEGFNETMQQKILRSEVCALHNPDAKMDYVHRITLVATMLLDYESRVKKYGTILIRPIGSFMPLYYNEIIEEKFDTDFPIEDYAEIVICENDRIAEYKWIEFLKRRYPNKAITTINYFDLRSENEVSKYFENAKYITFSTTFSSFDWFKKLTRFATNEHKILGYCHDPSKWDEALKINPNVTVIKSI